MVEETEAIKASITMYEPLSEFDKERLTVDDAEN